MCIIIYVLIGARVLYKHVYEFILYNIHILRRFSLSLSPSCSADAKAFDTEQGLLIDMIIGPSGNSSVNKH